MAQKPLTYILLVLLIGGGFLVGSFFGGSLVGGLVAPSDHRAIVEDFKIYDSTYGYLPKPTLITFGTLKYGESLSTLSVFKVDQPYQFSCWVFMRKGDVEMCMEIWGPDDSGHMYDVGFARLGVASGGHIEYQGETVMTIHDFVASPVVPNGQGVSTEGDYAITITR